MKYILVDNYVVETPLIEIVEKIQQSLYNGKLRDIKITDTDITVTCPNDNHAGGHEANPDCHINIEENNLNVPYGYFHCFACQATGSFIKFVALCFSRSEEFAKQWLITNYGRQVSPKVLLDTEITILNTSKKQYLDEAILDQYQTWTPYLAKRKLTREVCTNFKVRYDPKYRQVIFPVYDIKGHLKMLAKRSIDTKTFYLDKNQDKEVYGLNIIQKNNIKSCVITEGPIDMLTGWTYNIPTIATLGAVSNYQIDQLNKSCITSLYLAFDNDAAGERFTSLVENKLDKRILLTRIELPKDKKDLNDLTYSDWQTIIKKYFEIN